jgi:hypothetical protein
MGGGVVDAYRVTLNNPANIGWQTFTVLATSAGRAEKKALKYVKALNAGEPEESVRSSSSYISSIELLDGLVK